MGNMTRDPEVRFLDSGTAICEFGLAVNEKYKTAAGETVEKVHFIDCKAWGKSGENIGKFFEKGKPILVDGSLDFDSWETDDGQKRSKLRVKVRDWCFIPSKADSDTPDTVPDQQPEAGQESTGSEDSLPF
jgi:single-strand DNA-binding protein